MAWLNSYVLPCRLRQGFLPIQLFFMKWSVKLFTIKGITLRLHITLLLFVAWLTVLYMANGMQGQQLSWSILFLVALFASIALHEYGHALVASFFGINAKDITLFPIGGLASIEKLPKNPKQELLISSAGPAVNLVLAACCWLFFSQQNLLKAHINFTGVINSANFLPLLGVANLLLALFNLLPAFPLDGGRILRAIFAFWYNYVKATHMVATISKVVAALFVAYGLLSLDVMLLLLGFFILIFSKAEEAYLQLKALVKGIRLKEMLMYDYNSLDADLTASEAANVLQQKQSKVFLVMDKGQVIGSVNRLDVMKAIADQQYDTKMTSLVKNKPVSFDGETTVDKVLEKLSANDERLYSVMDKSRFIGVINFQHVIEYLLLHKVNTKDFAKVKSLVELV
jgi:Zn-dependent protease